MKIPKLHFLRRKHLQSKGKVIGGGVILASLIFFFFIRESGVWFQAEVGEDPVAYWKFDEGQGQSTNDTTGAGITGNLGATSGAEASDPTWTSEDMCVSGKCLMFDGDDDFLDMGSAPSLRFSYNDPFSVAAWIRWIPNASNQYPMILSQQSNANKFNYAMNLDESTGIIGFSVGESNVVSYTAVSTDSLTESKWHYAVGTYDGTTVKIYVDGILQPTTATYASGAISDPDMGFVIGDDDSIFGDRAWTGNIDQVKIYGYARTLAQIKGDYINRGGENETTAQFADSSLASGLNLSDGLVGYWKLDEATANTCPGGTNDNCDSSGNVHHAAWVGGATSGAGKFGNGVTLGGSGDYVDVGSDTFSDFGTGDFSLSIWVNTTSSDTRIAIGKFSSGSDDYWIGLGASGVATFGNTGVGAAESSASANDGKWHLLTGVRMNNMMYLYVDGVLKDSTPNTVSASPGGSLSIGRFGENNSFDWNGKLDDARIYNRGLSAAEVTALYQFAPGPAMHLKFDENAGTTAYDSSHNANNTVSFAGSPAWATGKFGSGLNFRSSSAITVANSNSIKIAHGLTVEGWFKPAVDVTAMTSDYPTALNKRPYQVGGYILYFVKSTGQAVFEWDYSGSYTTVNSTTTTFDANRWYHITGTYDGTVGRIYIDGVLEREEAVTTPMATSDDDLVLGGASNTSFEGVMDDVRIYNYARTPEQILEDMNAGNPNSAPLGHWKMDEGYGDTANNLGVGGATINGDLAGSCPGGGTCPTWTNDGKFGKALSFDGDDYVDVGNEAKFDNMNALTISTWVYPTNYSWFQSIVSKRSAWSTTGVPFELRLAGGFYGPSGSAVDAIVVGSSGGISSNTTTAEMPINHWYHLGLTWDGAEVVLYINGKEDNRVANTDASVNNDTAVTIGRNSESNEFYTGLIDELKIYNFALTKDQMQAEYNRGKSSVMGAQSTASDGVTPDNSLARSYCVPGDTSSCTPPVGEWKMDENTGAVTQDGTGNENSGSLGGGNASYYPTWKVGKTGSALNFNGSDQFVMVADSPSVSVTGSLTIEAWVKPSSLPTSGNLISLFSKYDTGAPGGAGGYDLRLYNDSGTQKIGITVINGSLAGGGGDIAYTLATNEWSHVVGVYDGTYGSIYVNGNYVDRITAGAVNPAYNAKSLNIGRFGALEGNSDSGRYFSGAIDTIRLYDYARTPAQIAWDYNKGAPLAWYKMDECTGTTIYNSAKTGNGTAMGNNGTLTIGGGGSNTTAGTCTTSGAWFDGATGKINSAMEFDGTDDYVSGTFNSSTNLSSASFFAWVNIANLPASGNRDQVYRIYNSAEDDVVLGFNVANDPGYVGRMQIIRYNSWGSDGKVWDCDNNQSALCDLATGQWIHIGVVQDSQTGYVHFFRNGQRIASYSSSQTTWGAGGYDTAGSTFTIGKSSGTSSSFDGQIDDARIYNYALTDAQARDVYNNGAVSFR